MLIYILLLNLISICLKAAIAFVATAGAASNLALNVYQQNAIDNTNADLTTKQHQIAQILSKGKHDKYHKDFKNPPYLQKFRFHNCHVAFKTLLYFS